MDLADQNTLAIELEEQGVCVVLNDVFTQPNVREALLDEARHFPEFLNGVDKYVMGGFAALGNPSSYHNPTVRVFREWAQAILIDSLFRDVVARMPRGLGEWKLEQKPERMTIRLPGEKTSSETWHRDEAVIMTTPHDVVYGGWINLDDVSQFFSCVLGSHTSVNHGGGFVKVSEQQAAHIRANKLSNLVEVPPGAIIVFNENIIHEVRSKKLGYTMIRLHTAWRLTPGDASMRPGLREQLDTQGIVTIKSGQIPPMYARLHWANWTDRLQQWSVASMRPECLETRTMQGGKRKGQSFTVVHEHMKSLEEYGFQKYRGYDESELSMYRPGTSWSLLVPGQVSFRKKYVL